MRSIALVLDNANRRPPSRSGAARSEPAVRPGYQAPVRCARGGHRVRAPGVGHVLATHGAARRTRSPCRADGHHWAAQKVLRGGRDFYHGAGLIHRYTEAALDAATHGIDLEVGADGIAPACFHCSIVIEGHRIPREDQPGLGTQAWSTLYESK